MNGRENEYDWAGPYASDRQVVAVLDSSDIYTLGDLEDRSVAMQIMSKPADILLERSDPRIPELKGVYCLDSINDGFITLEFTESFAYENYEFLSNIVERLHQNGFLCSIDDFGTGYSSYNILKTIRMDEIKLDKFFLDKGLSAERDQLVLESVIGMVKKLGMKVTQEGVETKEDLYRLEALGCDVIQGYYFAKPMKYSDYCDFVKNNFT